MYILKVVNRSLSKYLDVPFVLKFLALVLSLYYFNALYIDLTSPENRNYSPFLTHHLDYISWIRLSILQTSNIIAHQLGYHSYLADAYTLRIYGGGGVIMGWPCIGLGVMSFWIAFIVAQDTNWIKKLYWGLIGVAAIWFMNCWRVALLLIAFNNKWKVNNYNQHKMFNICCYLLIFVMIYWYYNKSKKSVKKLEGSMNVSGNQLQVVGS